MYDASMKIRRNKLKIMSADASRASGDIHPAKVSPIGRNVKNTDEKAKRNPVKLRFSADFIFKPFLPENFLPIILSSE